MTLVELTVTVAVLALVAVAAAQVSIGFQGQYAAENLKRQAADSARTGLVWIERDLRLAGYGMDPALAFDFNIWSKTSGTGANWCPTVGGPSDQLGCVRDHSNDGQPDELVFYARESFYWGADMQGAPVGKAWLVTAGTATDITLTVKPTDRFAKNQILQLVCPGGSQVVYSTVRDTTVAGAGQFNTVPADTGDPFRQAPSSLSCINAGGARAFLINRYRYAVDQTMLLGDNTTVMPTLVLDTGTDRNLDNVIDTKDLVRVSTGVIDLQVAYVRVNPPAAGSPVNSPGTLARVGGTPGTGLVNCSTAAWPLTNWTPCAGGMIVQNFVNRATLYPTFTGFGLVDMPLLAAPRQSPTYASISEVQVAAVARAVPKWRARQGAVTAMHVLPASMNRPAGNAPLDFEMHVADTAVPIRNTRTRALSFY